MLLAVTGVALVVRLLFVLVQTAFRVLDAPFVASDSILYLQLARSIAAGQGMRTVEGPTAFVGPVYPLFLTPLVALGLDPLGIGLVQVAVGAITAALVALAARELALAAGYDERPARLAMWVAGVATSVYPHVILWTGYVLTETLFLALAAACVYLSLRAARGGSVGVALTAGLVAATTGLTRPAFLACAAVIAAWLVWAPARRRWSLAAMFLLGVAVPMAAWTARNAIELGAPIVTLTQSGASLYQGNARGGTGGSRGYSDSLDVPPLALPAGLNEVERDRAYTAAALADIAADPGGAIAKWPSKLWNMWRPTYEGASLRNGAVSFLTYIPLLILGTLGCAALASRSRVGALPAFLLTVWVVTHMVIVGLIRYRVPGELFLLMALPAGIAAASAWLRRPGAVSRPSVALR